MFKIYTINYLKINVTTFTNKKQTIFISFNKNRFYTTEKTNNKKLDVLFFGTDEFAATHLKALIQEKAREGSCIKSIDLVCPPDKRTGRKLNNLTSSETKDIAQLCNVDVFHTPNKAENLDDWKVPSDKEYDLAVVVSFGYFIPPHIISQFKYGAINVHPSLLPKYRGASPIQHAIMYGDEETGVSIQELDDKKFDAGKILASATVDLKKKVPYYSELKDFLAKIGSKLLVDTVNNLDTRRETAIPQDITQVTKAPKVQKEWAELDFVNMTAWQAEQINRAIGEDYPLHTLYKNKPHKNTKTPKVFSVQLRDLFLPTKRILLDAGDPPGTFTYDHHTETLQMVFRDGSVVACSHLQFENKKIIEAKDFANGYERFGRFGLDDMIVDEWIMKKNMKKRAKMIQYQPKGEN